MKERFLGTPAFFFIRERLLPGITLFERVVVGYVLEIDKVAGTARFDLPFISGIRAGGLIVVIMAAKRTNPLQEGAGFFVVKICRQENLRLPGFVGRCPKTYSEHPPVSKPSNR